MIPDAIFVPAGEGRVIPRPDTRGSILLRLSREDTSGTATVFEGMRPVGTADGPAPHAHAFDELFYVLEGEYAFDLGDRTLTAQPGSIVFVPGGAVHGFRSSGLRASRILVVAVPGGVEEAFDALAALPSESDTDEVHRVATQHGIEYTRTATGSGR